MEERMLFFAIMGLGIASLLVAGVFQAFSDFVMRGLRVAGASGGMEAMKAINITVMRSAFVFLLLVIGPAAAVLAGYAFTLEDYRLKAILFFATAVYLALVLAVTLLGNVPMNEELARLVPESVEGAAYWQTYLSDWTRWNHLRTIGALIAGVAFIGAAFRLS